jgi:hypothetical protein
MLGYAAVDRSKAREATLSADPALRQLEKFPASIRDVPYTTKPQSLLRSTSPQKSRDGLDARRQKVAA